MMEAAARGAKEAGGRTIGIMPGVEGKESDRPNPYIDCSVFTGLSDGRNYINAYASDAIIALQGGPGTLSEIALAMKLKRPVVVLRAWDFLNGHGLPTIHHVEDAQHAVRVALKSISILDNGLTDSPLRFPEMPAQDAQRSMFTSFVMGQQ